MSKIVVNREQYMTCRLCLEQQGAYTIVPYIKDQIEYCFGIEIQPFDGMPQLICEKCEKILSNYSQLKRKYIENQAVLKTKILAHQLDKDKSQVTAPSSKSPAESPTENVEEKIKPKRKARIVSTSSSEGPSYNKSRKKRQRTASKESLKSSNSSPKGYNKQYVCRICNTRWSNVILVKNHVANKHGHLYKKYGHIIRKHCQVAIPKIDLGNPDHGFADKIMFSKDKIMKSVQGSYFITYTTRNYKDGASNSRPSSGLSNRARCKQKQLFNESSDEDDVCTLKKRKRVSSASSTDTINLETKTEIPSDSEVVTMDAKSNILPPPTMLGECILLDDSSDDESIKSETQKIQPETAVTKTLPKAEKNTINEILNSCRTKYIKKHILDSFSLKSAKNPSEVATQLKRKVLSVGRKIINRKIGFNCTPLVRFLENKNLDIAWISRESSQVHDANFDANYIRIMARTYQAGEKENADSETGWSDCTPPPSAAVTGSNTEPVPTVAGPIVMMNGVSGHLNGVQVVSASMPELKSLLIDSNLGGGKLLNANPVANPKQLPRKAALGDVTHNVPATSQEASEEPCMPIIMSTTSLAVPQTDQREVSKPDTPKPAEAPRIKVKPVSELMSAATLQRMKTPAQTPAILTPQNPTIAVQKSQVFIPPGSFVFVPRVTAGTAPAQPEQGAESMVLNTVELPNKRTNSPFLYFRNLLQIHDLILLDTHAELLSEFQSLIKFKVMYKQENHYQDVVLCIALHCARNMFCFKIKDRNQQDIDMSKITANWQWEVLKTFKSEVVPKVLASAQKIGPEQYMYTNKFLCLLKSIELVQ